MLAILRAATTEPLAHARPPADSMAMEGSASKDRSAIAAVSSLLMAIANSL
jgi:hypothetical protein